MKFSVGFIDEIFGKRETLEVNGPDGKIIRRQVTSKWLKKMIADKKILSSVENSIAVYILDVVRGASLHSWVIGQDIDVETVEKWGDKKTNAIYIINHYKNGESIPFMVGKETWEQTKNKFDSV